MIYGDGVNESTRFDQTPEVTRQILMTLSDTFRWRAYECLRSLGDMKGREIAPLIHVSESSALRHLRALHSIGFVTFEGDSPRQATWHAVPGGVRVPDDSTEREALTDALAGWLGVTFSTQASILRDSMEESEHRSADWQEAIEHYDYVLHLTSDELFQLSKELRDVVTRWLVTSREREDKSQVPSETEPVYVVTHATPFPRDNTTARAK